MPTTHTESESHPWQIEIPDHPPRSDSPEYVQSRKRMNQLDPGLYGKRPVQDHHGGGLWAWENDDPENGAPFLVLNLVGVEWSSQFCADPAKVDKLRLNALRFYSMFPKSAETLGITTLLETAIKTADGVAAWVDSICNASVPLPPLLHTGILAKGAGQHHYPKPITDIESIRYDDFVLFPAVDTAVTPVAPRGSGDGRVAVVYAPSLSPLRAKLKRAKKPVILPANHPLAKKAFAKQGG